MGLGSARCAPPRRVAPPAAGDRVGDAPRATRTASPTSRAHHPRAWPRSTRWQPRRGHSPAL